MRIASTLQSNTVSLERRTLGTSEIQKITGLGRAQVQKLVRNGVLPNLGTQRKILVSQAAIQKGVVSYY